MGDHEDSARRRQADDQEAPLADRRLTRTFYDALRRVVAIRDPLGRTITQQWCKCGSLDALIDARGNATRWERDAAGRVTREIRADGTTSTTYTYEAASGRLATVTDPKGQVTTYSYALDDRLTDLTFTNVQIATHSVSYTYDADYPRMATMVDGTGTTDYTYQAAGSLGAGQVASVGGPLADDTITYDYDALGRVTGRAINGVGLTLAYDALGRVTTETNVLGTFTYTYDGVSGRLATVAYPNSQTSTYTYLPNAQDHRLQTIHHKYPGGATLSKFDYTYDAVGNVLTWQQQAESQAPVLWTYGYDAADQLTRAVEQTTDPTPVILKRYAYGYDSAANRVTEQIDDAVTGSAYDSLNRLVTQTAEGTLHVAGTVSEPAVVTVNGQPTAEDALGQFVAGVPVTSGSNTLSFTAVDASGNSTTQTYTIEQNGTGKAFTYDANGNLTSDGARTFEWDARNRIVSIVGPSGRTDFDYDGRDRRVRLHQAGLDTQILWCGRAICAQKTTGGTWQQLYGAAESTASGSIYVLRDHLGSARAFSNQQAAVTGRVDYDPYGRRLNQVGDSSSIGFGGYHFLAAASLDLTWARAYDPALGRWLSQDPLNVADGVNRYAYVAGNPLRSVDPDGLFCVPTRLPYTRWIRYRREFTPMTDWWLDGDYFLGEQVGSVGCVWKRWISVGDYEHRYVLVRWSCKDCCPTRVWGYWEWNEELRERGYTKLDRQTVFIGMTELQSVMGSWKCLEKGPPQ